MLKPVCDSANMNSEAHIFWITKMENFLYTHVGFDVLYCLLGNIAT